MNITTQGQAHSYSNWLNAGDLLNFARKIWAPVKPDMDALERKVDELYGAACKRFPTYDGMVHLAFCAGMDEEFGTDEFAAGVAEVFAYAREAYGYMSAQEIEAQQAEDAEAGICAHGLDANCCPCGCGDLSEFEDDFDHTELYGIGAIGDLGVHDDLD